MAIIFHCQGCHKEIKAPDDAGGRRGKCPHCGASNYIPTPVSDEELLDLAPLDEREEQERRREVDRLLQADKTLLSETTRVEKQPRLSQRDPSEVKPEDLHHLVINFLLDMAAGQLERADLHVMKLNQYHGASKQAVRDFLDGKVLEPALDSIPTKVRDGLLKNLMTRLR